MKFNDTKKIMAIVLAVIMICTAFVGCSKNKDEGEGILPTVNATENTSDEDKTEASTEEQAEATTEATTQKETTTQKVEATTKKQVTTTKKTETTTKKKPTQTTTKPAPKPTTTKPQTTVKHVTAKEVQNQVNDYIKNTLGVPLDPTLTPENAGWSGQISAWQEYLDSGKTLSTAKYFAKADKEEWNANRMYCYLDTADKCIYVLYMGSTV